MSARFIKFGFTLIELLVVISIIGILATLVAANLNSARSRARDTQRKSDLKNIETALRLFYNDNGYYPTSDNNQIVGCNESNGNFQSCAWGSAWAEDSASCGAGATCYMQTLPKDPLSSQSYSYVRTNVDSYTLSACLENTSDPSGENASVNGNICWAFQVTQ